jgi:hypothetical protein
MVAVGYENPMSPALPVNIRSSVVAVVVTSEKIDLHDPVVYFLAATLMTVMMNSEYVCWLVSYSARLEENELAY